MIDTILARRSVRRYVSEPVTEGQTGCLLEAAMAAPSANNSKPWHFVVVRERAKLDLLADIHPYAKMLRQATLCIVPCGAPSLDKGYWVQDLSASTENILLAAVGLGLGTCWCGVHPREQRVKAVRQALGIPGNIVPFCLIAVGHPAEQKEPRTQYDESRVHREQW